jgi:hypothetical protein
MSTVRMSCFEPCGGRGIYTRDSVIRPEVLEQDLKMFGHQRWVGDLRAELIDMGYSKEQIRAVIGAAVTEAKRYGNTTSKLEPGVAGGLRASNPEYATRPEKQFGEPTSPMDVQKANEEFWANRSGEETGDDEGAAHPAGTMDGHRGPVTAAMVQKSNDAYWGARRAEQNRDRRELGKG